ncbi:MAG: lysophospholipase [Clostridia bacterium]|nr:lysophospholipase [Clostridia bacterium]
MKTEEARVTFAEYQVPVGEGTSLHVRAWAPEAPRAVIQIAHGMAEHGGRYGDFAAAIALAGIAVYAADHAGHGKSATPEKYGHFYAKNGWRQAVEDLHAVRASIEERHPGVPLVLLGHSMGSLMARSYITRHGEGLGGVILSGTGGPNPLLPVGKLLAAIEMRRLPAYRPSLLIDKLVFGAYSKPFAPARTPFDWLSRDPGQVDAYIADPACGFPFTAAGYRDVFAGLSEIQAKGWAAGVPAGLPVLIISGERDPVGGMGKGVRWVEKALRGAGVRDVTCALYPEARHELLNETNRAEVYADVLAWISRVLAA